MTGSGGTRRRNPGEGSAAGTAAATGVGSWPTPRLVFADNLKVALVAGVILAHVIMAWVGLGTWVLSEPPVREPLLSLLIMLSVVGVLFGMPLFFLVAGMFTPGSLRRKGFRTFAKERTLRLLLPSVLFALLLSPPIEYFDTDNAGWTKGFWAFVPTVWWQLPPPPGPTWFLGVLLLLSLGYAAIRSRWPGNVVTVPLRVLELAVAAALVAASSFLMRLVVPFGEERWHLAVSQAPGWVVGFILGVIGRERGWFLPMEPRMAKIIRLVAWMAMAACVGVVGGAVGLGMDLEVFTGHGTWQSLVLAIIEGVIVVTVSLWFLDLFRRRFNDQGAFARQLSRAAYATFLVHQLVLVGLVVLSRRLPWPPELKFLTVSVLGLVFSFALGAALVRLPGVSRIL
nr:acyltransferase [Microlunatus panaciterrae]